MKVPPHEVFVPTRWVEEDELFVGRQEELSKIKRSLRSAGANVVLYGARGLGKTTIARHVQKELEENVIWIDCDSNINKGDFIVRLFNKLKINRLDGSRTEFERDSLGFKARILGLGGAAEAGSETKETSKPFSDAINSVDYVCDRLQELDGPAVVILDEFDLVSYSTGGKSAVKFIVELIKAVSGRGRNLLFRFVIVGVGNSVQSLIGEHGSIERNIIEVKVDKIQTDYLKLFLINAQKMTGYIFESSVEAHFVEQADGYPYFVHLVGLECCNICESLNSERITFEIYEEAFDRCFRDHYRGNRKRFSSSDRDLSDIERSVVYMLAHERNPIVSFRSCFTKYGAAISDKYGVFDYDKLKSAAEKLSKSGFMIYRMKDTERYGFIDPIMKVFLRERFFLKTRNGYGSDRTRRQLEFPSEEITEDDL